MPRYTQWLSNDFIRNSDLFVDFFFVLSGFVIAYSYSGRLQGHSTFSGFMKRRFLRLYPLHIILLFAFLVLETGKFFLYRPGIINTDSFENNNAYTFFQQLFLLNSIKLPGINDLSWNYPAWSIGAEFVAYLVFAWVFSAFRFVTVTKGFILFGVALLVYLIIAMQQGSLTLDYTFDYGFMRALLEFSVGVLVWLVRKNIKVPFDGHNLGFSLAELGVLVMVVVSIIHGNTLREAGFVFPLVFAFSIFVFSFERGIVTRLLVAVPLLRRIGQYSYSIYMLHALVLVLVDILVIRILKLPASVVWLVPIINIVVIYCLAKISYNRIELAFYKRAVTKA
ncbi:MAG: acyltransferase [Chitinophagaceae bacterium]|jgi:peptidoglycan/LPS O-acetylase OafA/YrhL|nr:acyltransferase [Chitinophagaceae bacterium]